MFSTIIEKLFTNQLNKTIELLTSFIISVLIARIVSSETFGEYSFLISSTTFIILILSLGFEQIANKYLSDESLSDENKKYIIIKLIKYKLISLLIASGLFVCLIKFDFFNYKSFIDKKLVIILSLYIITVSFGEFLKFIYYGLLKIKSLCFINSTLRIGLACVLAFFLFNDIPINLFKIFELFTFFNFLILAGFLGYIYFSYLKNHNSETIKFSPIFKFGIILWLISFTDFALGKQVDIILLKFFNVSNVEIGYYNISHIIAVLASTFLLFGFAGVGLSVYSKIFSKQGIQGLKKFYLFSLKLSMILTLPIMFFVIFFSKEIIHFFYGSKYIGASKLILTFTIFFMGQRILGGGDNITSLYVMNKAKTALKFRNLNGIMNLIFNLILIPVYGAAGAVFATGVSGFVTVIFEFIYVKRSVKFNYPVLFFIKIFGASVIPILAVYFLSKYISLHIVFYAVFYFLIYFLIILKLNLFNNQSTQFKSVLPKILQNFFSDK